MPESGSSRWTPGASPTPTTTLSSRRSSRLRGRSGARRSWSSFSLATQGYRKGEIIPLQWDDLDVVNGTITVALTEYRGQVGTPKGGKTRVVPMTARLQRALKAFWHLRGPRVFYRADSSTHSEETVRGALIRVEKRAGLPAKGKRHKLRHTFCSRLAMANVPMITIQALAGHESIETTQRYMHLSHAAPVDAAPRPSTRSPLGETWGRRRQVPRKPEAEHAVEKWPRRDSNPRPTV